jgi:Zn-dependent protease with chaperone function
MGIYTIFVTILVSFFIYAPKRLLKDEKLKIATQSEYPRLHKAINNIYSQNKLTKVPSIYIMNAKEPNAYMIGANIIGGYIIVVTEQLYNLVTYNELEAIIAHEVAHNIGHDYILKLLSVIFFSTKMAIYVNGEIRADAQSALLTKTPNEAINALVKVSVYSSTMQPKNFPPIDNFTRFRINLLVQLMFE